MRSFRKQSGLVACSSLGLFAAAVAVSMISTAKANETWASFRNGGASHATSTLPTKWTSSEGIAWQRELTGYGQSAPVILDGKIFVSSVAGPMCETLVVQCLDLSSGEPLWQYERPAATQHASNYMNARAAPTPMVDRDGVYVFFESGDFVCLDHRGELRWHRNEAEAFGKFENNHGIGSSPAMDERNLYLLVEHDGPSSLAAIDKMSGKTVWQTKRSSTKSWASPIVAQAKEGPRFVVVSSGGTVTGYSATDGTQAWQIDGIEGNSIPSPTAVDGRILVGARLPEFATDGQVQANCCLDLSKIVDGKPKVLWRADKAICHYASPVACDGHAYFVSKANVLHCIDVASGDVLYRKRLTMDCWATPIVSGNAIYYFGKNGQTRVIRGGPEYVEVATNDLWNTKSPPAPESYVESTAGSSGHGNHGGHGPGGLNNGEQTKGGEGHGHGNRSSRPGVGMVARMMSGDANKDGILETEELPAAFRPMMPRIDSNGDGKLDAKELEAMAKSFAERRKDAAASARDPIVYGVAAADGKIVVRTGTRLYVIGG